MRRFGREPGGRGRARPVQYFDYGPLQFNINRATLLAANRAKYRPETRQPTPDWIGPGIEIDAAHVGHCDPRRPVLFATFALPGHPRELLIDGNHRVAYALKYRQAVRAVVLDLEDTLKVLTGPEPLIQQIKHEGHRLGLLSPRPGPGSLGAASPG
jgi:hypothetical protein